MEQKRVMIVEDHEKMRDLLKEIVEKEGDLIVVGTAQNGIEACEQIRQLEPDVVLLDLVMPGMDGLGVLEEMKRCEFTHNFPKFIVVSAVGEEHVIGEAFRLGASYYVMKPFDPEALISRIRSVIKGVEKTFYCVRKIPPYEDLCSVEKKEIEAEIGEILRGIGVPVHVRGYAYLKMAISLSLVNIEMLQSVTGKLYPTVAEAFNTTGSRVERAIRHAIESAWDRSESSQREELFGYTIHKAKGKPTNSEFIALIADKLKMDFGW